MSYDRSKTTFSPEGHLLQVQYAHRAAQNGSLVIALSGASSTIVIVEQKLAARLQQKQDKIVQVSDLVYAVFSGLTADSRILVQQCRIFAASHALRLAKAATAADVAQKLGELAQSHTQIGGKRPFGACGIVFDAQQIFTVDPSGVVQGWKAVAIGGNASKIQDILAEKWKAGMDKKEAEKIGREVICEVVEGEDMEVKVLEARGQ
ncbi:20S proteasome alpha subunit 4 [Spironucleus salmonicida]|uniref:20S proteasome alpha subunit 4 n=1 Tax=Spironucleus salmonicida TaxID=348837 RepID=V6LFL4_9EUKA|nr:20S proteasome alpha subunit 4 [Spironucleus salmonicida]|eukprot:EST43083.1 20S proteasome alpha subunit 4 [Spironucleus salmonicida]